MIIKEFIELLEALPEKTIITNVNISEFGSDRGNYCDFYIGESDGEETTISEILRLLKNSVLGRTFIGYKGGDYTMNEYTEIKLGGYGYSGSYIDGILFEYDYNKGVIAKVKAQQVLYY